MTTLGAACGMEREAGLAPTPPGDYEREAPEDCASQRDGLVPEGSVVVPRHEVGAPVRGEVAREGHRAPFAHAPHGNEGIAVADHRQDLAPSLATTRWYPRNCGQSAEIPASTGCSPRRTCTDAPSVVSTRSSIGEISTGRTSSMALPW